MKNLSTLFAHYGIGLRSLTEDDFWRICEIEQITVIESEQGVFSFVLLGRKFIALPKSRKGLKRLFSLLHELGHLLLMNGKEPAFAFQGLKHCDNDRAEAEADAIALIALMPRHLIEQMQDEMCITRYGAKLWRERRRLYFLYGV